MPDASMSVVTTALLTDFTSTAMATVARTTTMAMKQHVINSTATASAMPRGAQSGHRYRPGFP